MKKNSLLLLASLAVLTSGASAAMNRSASEPIVLPTYVVTAPRHIPVELQINASLQALRQQARTLMVIAPDLSTLKAQAVHNPVAQTGHGPAAVRIAKS